MRSTIYSAGKLFVLAAAVASLASVAVRAAEETCSSCEKKVSFSGDYVHRRAPRATFDNLPAGTDDSYRDGIFGSNFTVSVSGLPEGRYTVIVGALEASSDITNVGERVFDISVGDQVLAKDADIIATAGGTNKIALFSNTIEHHDDNLGGPLVLTFKATKGEAKMNTLEIKNADGTSLVMTRTADLMDIAGASERQIPVISGPVVWLDPDAPRAARIKDLVSRMSLAEKVRQMGNGAPAIHRTGLDLPAYNYWSEALHGVATRGVTVFPESIGNGATWDPDLIKQMSHVIGIEGRAKNNYNRAHNNGNSPQFGGLNFWSPNINIFRDPRWGRGQETYGEDTFLTSRMGVAFIQGLQGNDPKYTLALACAKHYAVHSGPEAQRHVIDVHPSERDLYETYLPHFEAAVREGHVGAVMSAYNAVDGVPAPASDLLLKLNLRDRWGFDGQVVSDCDSVADIYRTHHYVKSAAEAAALAIKAGNDLCCGSTYNSLLAAVRSNFVSVPEIDVCLGRILESRFKLGLFDPTNLNPLLLIGTNQIDTPEDRELALQLSRESMVLLKNDGVLPINRAKVHRIAVIGANASDSRMLYGNYNGTPNFSVTILDGIRALAGSNTQVTFAEGCPLIIQPTNGGGRGFGRGGFGGGPPPAPPRPLPVLHEEAMSNALNADLVIYVGGINSQLEGEEGNARGSGGVEGFSNGDRTRIELPSVQENLVQDLRALGKPMIMVNCSGSPMALTWESDHLDAILQAWYPGEQGGRAVAETLFGSNNPAGRLPLTFYRATTDLPNFTNYSMENRTYRYYTGKPLYAFGHGLSYSSFTYSSPSLSTKHLKTNSVMTVTFKVHNTSKLDGDEVAQIYFKHINSPVPQPLEALCAFKRVHVPAGKTVKVTVDIPAERLRYWDTPNQQYIVENGNYRLLVGAASDDLRRQTTFKVVK